MNPLPKTSELFPALPEKLRHQLLDEYTEIHSSYILGKHRPAELNAGRFCEIVYSILKGYLDNNYPNEATKPKNFIKACSDLELYSTTTPRSIKILIPRLLSALYEVRSNRNIGHVSGDINPNFMDSTLVFKAASWILAELIRVLHGLNMQDAQLLVDQLSFNGNIPFVWQIDERNRVLKPELSPYEKTLIILYQNHKRSLEDLAKDVNYSSASMFRKRVIEKGAKECLWEFNDTTKNITISPLGSVLAEKLIKQASSFQ